MNEAKQQLLHAVERYRRWTTTIPIEHQVDEWECRCPDWPGIYEVTANYLASVDVKQWDNETIDALLYIIARDNENGRVIKEAVKYPEKLLVLGKACIHSFHSYAKWQIANELVNFYEEKPEIEDLLYALAKDHDEYTRRHALGALGEVGSPLVDELVEPAWSSNHQFQRMKVIEVLHKTGSPELEKYLKLAESDGRGHLMNYVEVVRQGKTCNSKSR